MCAPIVLLPKCNIGTLLAFLRNHSENIIQGWRLYDFHQPNLGAPFQGLGHSGYPPLMIGKLWVPRPCILF